MKKNVFSVCGAIALMLGVGLNVQNSLNDYGLKTNSLSTFALAQGNSSGSSSSGSSSSGSSSSGSSSSGSSSSGSSSSGSGWLWELYNTNRKCTATIEPTSGGISITLPGGWGLGFSEEGGKTITYEGTLWVCRDGWNLFCKSDCK